MKQTYDLTGPTSLSEIPNLLGRENGPLDHLVKLGRETMEKIPGRGQLLKTGGATLFISCLILAGTYLFLTQLAEYGW
jgi:hypothetical protein